MTTRGHVTHRLGVRTALVRHRAGEPQCDHLREVVGGGGGDVAWAFKVHQVAVAIHRQVAVLHCARALLHVHVKLARRVEDEGRHNLDRLPRVAAHDRGPARCQAQLSDIVSRQLSDS
eukprot:3759551-Pyramimonas_sp.AAC.3